MFPQLSEALLHERVREFHRAAEAGRRVRLARQGRCVAAATATHRVTVLRSLTTAGRAHAPAPQDCEPISSRAA
jgi:hypothetical protein